MFIFSAWNAMKKSSERDKCEVKWRRKMYDAYRHMLDNSRPSFALAPLFGIAMVDIWLDRTLFADCCTCKSCTILKSFAIVHHRRRIDSSGSISFRPSVSCPYRIRSQHFQALRWPCRSDSRHSESWSGRVLPSASCGRLPSARFRGNSRLIRVLPSRSMKCWEQILPSDCQRIPRVDVDLWAHHRLPLACRWDMLEVDGID